VVCFNVVDGTVVVNGSREEVNVFVCVVVVASRVRKVSKGRLSESLTYLRCGCDSECN
jgi:hypothetical protein